MFCTASNKDEKDKLTCNAEPRTLETLKRDLASFDDNGGNLKSAKLFNNVINEPIVNVPLDQVILLKKSIFEHYIKDSF